MTIIALDVMGGDHSPEEDGKGAFLAAAEHDVSIALIGPKSVVDFQIAQHENLGGRVVPVYASQVVGMAESPTDAWRDKRDSSIAAGVRMLKEGTADAFVSAGNTGAIATEALLTLGMIKGIERPAIATLFLNQKRTITIALDIGANVECRPQFLVEFAHMGADFMSKVFKIQNPRIALLSNGEEENKGTKLVKEAHKLLKATSGLNFVGNIDGFDIYSGVADVIVTDGFTGNVALKLAEGLTQAVFTSVKDALMANTVARATKILWGPPFKAAVKQFDYSSIGGAPLLGVAGNVIMAHGRSDAKAIKNAVGLAVRVVHAGGWQQAAFLNLEASAAHLNS